MTWVYGHQFFVLGAIMIAGFGVLGWFLFEARRRIAMMLGHTPHPSGDLMHDLLRRVMRTETLLEAMEPRLAATETVAQKAVQKVGFLRFNPFQDTGGDNSFIIVMLDSENNGFIFSSLYMREGTRLYAKAVERGGVKQPLSDEEQRVLEETIKKNYL